MMTAAIETRILIVIDDKAQNKRCNSTFPNSMRHADKSLSKSKRPLNVIEQIA